MLKLILSVRHNFGMKRIWLCKGVDFALDKYNVYNTQILFYGASMKLKILYLILSIILAVLLNGDSQKEAYIHFEVPNKIEMDFNYSEKNK